jgi:glycogen(starch) synthase
VVLSTEPGRGGLNRTALWVVPVPDLGGVARHVLDVARVGLPGWRLVVLCPEGPLAERLRELGSAVIAEPFGPGAGFATSVATLRTNIKRLRPDVVHSHLAYADVVAAAAVLGLDTRLVTTEHGIAGNDAVYHGSVWKSRLKALMHRIRLRRAGAVISVSESTRDAMLIKWRPKQPIAVIPNGVDAVDVRQQVDALRTDANSAKGDKPGLRVLSLSRLAPEKRLDVLLRAFALVRDAESAATLVIAGEGPERESLERLAAQLGLSGSVDFVGFVDPLMAMAEADVLVQLSVWENCSYTLLDAVSAGLGVVATAVGGNPEILPEECLVAADDEAAVAETIEAQALDAMQRPSPQNAWPDLTDMAGRIVGVYDGTASKLEHSLAGVARA